MKNSRSFALTALKFICETSLYVSVIGLLLAMMHSTSPIFESYTVLFVFTMLAFLLREIKVVWILPHIFALSAFLYEVFFGQTVNIVWLAPIWIYSILFNAKRLYNTDTDLLRRIYRIGIFLSPAFALAASGFSNMIAHDNGSMVYSLVFIISGMLCMRYARHDNSKVATSYFNKINLVSVVSVVLASTAVYAALVGAYFAVTFIISLFPDAPATGNVDALQPRSTPQLVLSETVQEVTAPPKIKPSAEKDRSLPVLGVLLLVVLVAALIAIYVKHNRREGTRQNKKIMNTSNTEEAKEKSNRLSVRDMSARAKVRRCYRKFMLLCIENHISITQSSTALEIIDAAKEIGFSPSECDRLYRVYTLARYSPNEITGAEAKEATELYRVMHNNRKKAGNSK